MGTLSYRRTLAVSAACVALLATSAAEAQLANDAAGSGEIIVTAQKREEALIDVPQSISVVSGATLEAQHADSFEDYLRLVPGLQLDQSRQGQGRLIIRGVNTDGVASTVSVYMDETPFGSSSGLVNGAVLAADFDTFDLERIEVLRGPQGTLYGASSLSGVLKFVTRDPSTTALQMRGRAGVETTDGGEESYYANAVVNVPLSDTVAFRASGTYRKEGGFVDSIGTGGSDVEDNINDAEVYGGRASLLFRPNDTLSLRLTAVLQDIKADAGALIESNADTLEPLYGELSQSQFVPSFSDLRYRVYNATGTFDLGFGELTSSTSYATQKQRLRSDYTFALSGLVALFVGGPNEFFQDQRTETEKFTQELRLAGETDAFEWLVGGYYTNEDGLIFQDFIAVSPGTTTPIAGAPLLGLATIDSKYEEIAAFANVTIHFGEQFALDLGGRYSNNDQNAHQVSDGALAGGFNDFGVIESSEDVFTYSVAPRFEMNENTSIYARVAKGFRPGGPNILPPGAPAEFGSYESDSVINYELGVKTQSADGRLGLDVAVFHIEWDNIQLLATEQGFNFNANGGGAKSSGVEFSARANPADGLALSVNGAYTDAKLTTDTEIGGLDGDQLPFTPKFSGSANFDYSWPVGGDAEATFGASLRHVSRQSGGFDEEYRADNGRQRRLRSYQVIDFRAGVDFGRFNLEAYVRNLGNRRGQTSTTGTTVFGAFPLYPNDAIGTGIIRPRTFGLALTADF